MLVENKAAFLRGLIHRVAGAVHEDETLLRKISLLQGKALHVTIGTAIGTAIAIMIAAGMTYYVMRISVYIARCVG